MPSSPATTHRGFSCTRPLWGAMLLALAAGAGAAAQEDFPVPELPSGVKAELLESFLDIKPDGTLTYARFRFVAPGLVGEGAPDYESRLKDMDVLCRDYALPHVAVTPDRVDVIVISIADRPSEFGVADPETTQFFESYSVENGTCIWGDF